MNEPAVLAKNLVKKFDSFTAVDGLDLAIEPGIIYGLLGPNGSGKTTTIRMLCGLTKPTSGESYILGVSSRDKRCTARLGYMPQEVALYNDLTVGQNLDLFGELHGMDKQSIRTRKDELLRLIELKDWENVLLAKLSGGMKRRASLVCAMIHNPPLLILDEPTVGVDPELRDSFWKHFDALKKSGTAVLITTHYMDEARNCDRVGFIRAGKLIAEDAPASLARRAGTVDLEQAFLKYARGEAR